MVTIRAFVQRRVAALDVTFGDSGFMLFKALGACTWDDEDLTTYVVEFDRAGVRVTRNRQLVEDEAQARDIASRLALEALMRL